MATIPEFPNYPTGQQPVIYMSTDAEARKHGCSWGRVMAHIGSGFWVLTSIGVRYYGIEDEHEFLTWSDAGWDAVHACWMAGLEAMADLQRLNAPESSKI